MCATNKVCAAEATPREKARAFSLLRDPASPRIVHDTHDLCDAITRPWLRSGIWVMLATATRPSRTGALVWAGSFVLMLELVLWLRPDLRIDWPAILVSLLTVLTPLLSITIPLAVHTVRQRGRLVAEYFPKTCRLEVFCVMAATSLLLNLVSLVCFRISTDVRPAGWAIALVPSAVLGLTMASVLGLAYILWNTLACTGLEGRTHASRYLAACLAGKAIPNEHLREQLTIVYADLVLLMADADLASFRALVRSLAQVPRCYTRLSDRPHGLQLDKLWEVHSDIMRHVLGRGDYSTSVSKPGPIAARFAAEHARALSGEFMACVRRVDPQNLAAAARAIRWFYGSLHSAKSDQNLPREVSQALYELRGSAAFYYSLPESLLGHLPSETDAATTANIIQILRRGMMALVVEAAERRDHGVVDAVSKGVADLYAAAEKRLTALGAFDAIRMFTYDYWILLGHFVTRAVEGAEGAWEVAMALHKPLGQVQPLDLMKMFLGLPEPTWEHPLYVRERESWSAYTSINPVTGFGVGSARSIGQPGHELNAAFAFLLAHSWRTRQQKPDTVPCPSDLGEVNKRLDEILAKADGWHLCVLEQDTTAMHQWLDDCAAAHRAIESAKYLATPLSETKKREFEQNLRTGFWEGAVLLRHIPMLVSKPADGGETLQCWAIHGPRSLYFGNNRDPDIARFGHDSGVHVATFLHKVVVSRWCQAVAVPPAGSVDPVSGMIAASDWLGQTQADWDGLIVIVGPYELRARVEALPDYRPHTAQPEYSREFFGTYRGHVLLWLRTDQNDATLRLYAFRLSALREQGAGDGAAPCGVDRDDWPKVTFREARDLAAEYRSEGRTQDADEIAKRPGDVYVMAELGRVSPDIPEGRVWDLSDGNALPANTRTS